MDKAMRDKLKTALQERFTNEDRLELISDLEAAEARIVELEELLEAYSVTRYPTLAQQNEAYAKRIAELEESRRWIPVEERLPQKRENALVCLPEIGMIVGSPYEDKYGKWWMDTSGRFYHIEGSSWQPLPPSPTQAGEQAQEREG